MAPRAIVCPKPCRKYFLNEPFVMSQSTLYTRSYNRSSVNTLGQIFVPRSKISKAFTEASVFLRSLFPGRCKQRAKLAVSSIFFFPKKKKGSFAGVLLKLVHSLVKYTTHGLKNTTGFASLDTLGKKNTRHIFPEQLQEMF